MKFIKCKNDAEKIEAIKDYCIQQINENYGKIDWYKLNQECSLDYADEIHELKLINKRFEKILEIIEADENTSVPI